MKVKATSKMTKLFWKYLSKLNLRKISCKKLPLCLYYTQFFFARMRGVKKSMAAVLYHVKHTFQNS